MPDTKLKLLIADDHLLFINGLKLILQELPGIEIPDIAVNGKEAIDKCLKQKFDVVLMDINMPIIDGIEATREIKRHDENTKVLIISMNSDLDTVSRVMKAGADGFLLKNADTSEFIRAFKAIQNNQIYMSDHYTAQFALEKSDKSNRKDYIKFTENIITQREKSVLKMISEGFTNPQIAETLSLSVMTVNTHRNNMLAKLNLHNTAALVKFAIDNKLV